MGLGFSILLLIGKKFWNDGNIYEGEWKDDKRNGQGKKSALLNHLLILTLFNALIGKYFFNAGGRYEGECKDDKKHGQGKKSALLNFY